MSRDRTDIICGNIDQELVAVKRRHLQGQGRGACREEVCVSIPGPGICRWIQGASIRPSEYSGKKNKKRKREWCLLTKYIFHATGPSENIQVRRTTYSARLPHEALRIRLRVGVRQEDGQGYPALDGGQSYRHRRDRPAAARRPEDQAPDKSGGVPWSGRVEDCRGRRPWSIQGLAMDSGAERTGFLCGTYSTGLGAMPRDNDTNDMPRA